MSCRRRTVSFWIVVSSLILAFSLPAQTFSSWSHVENLGEVVNTTASDSCLFVTRSGLRLFFGSSRPGGAGGLDLYVSQRDSLSDSWGVPQSLGATLNGAGFDHLPFITADGHTMVFASDRAGGPGLNDLYMTFRRNVADDFGWEAPVLIPGVNTVADEYGSWGFEDPATGALTIYFSSDRPGGSGGFDIYATTQQPDGSFSTPLPVVELNTESSDVMPTIREDGLEMFLTSNRPGGLGLADIYTSTRASTSDPWSAPRNVGAPVNTSSGEQRAGTFGDATNLYFFSGRPGGVGGTDLYRASRTATTLIPIVGSTSGVNGQVFKTTAQLGNPGPAEISGSLVFHPAGVPAGEGDPQFTYRLAPYESQVFSDLMASFGVNGVGSVEIVPAEGRAPASAFRIENGGSMVVPSVDRQSVMSTGAVTAVKMPSDTNRFRLNVGIRTLDSGASIWICMHDPDGTFIRGASHSYPPNYLLQLPVATLLDGEVTADQMIMFTIESGSAVVFASTVANSGHASTLQVARPIGE